MSETILPAIRDGLIKNRIRIENEYQVDEYMNYKPSPNSILNIDLDFFSPEMNFIQYEKKMKNNTKSYPHVDVLPLQPAHTS